MGFLIFIGLIIVGLLCFGIYRLVSTTISKAEQRRKRIADALKQLKELKQPVESTSPLSKDSHFFSDYCYSYLLPCWEKRRKETYYQRMTEYYSKRIQLKGAAETFDGIEEDRLHYEEWKKKTVPPVSYQPFPKPMTSGFSLPSKIKMTSSSQFPFFVPCYESDGKTFFYFQGVILAVDWNRGTIKTFSYSSITVSKSYDRITTSTKRSYGKLYGIHFLHENRNGMPDRRYSYNPATYYYREYHLKATLDGVAIMQETYYDDEPADKAEGEWTHALTFASHFEEAFLSFYEKKKNEASAKPAPAVAGEDSPSPSASANSETSFPGESSIASPTPKENPFPSFSNPFPQYAGKLVEYPYEKRKNAENERRNNDIWSSSFGRLSNITSVPSGETGRYTCYQSASHPLVSYHGVDNIYVLDKLTPLVLVDRQAPSSSTFTLEAFGESKLETLIVHVPLRSLRISVTSNPNFHNVFLESTYSQLQMDGLYRYVGPYCYRQLASDFDFVYVLDKNFPVLPLLVKSDSSPLDDTGADPNWRYLNYTLFVLPNVRLGRSGLWFGTVVLPSSVDKTSFERAMKMMRSNLLIREFAGSETLLWDGPLSLSLRGGQHYETIQLPYGVRELGPAASLNFSSSVATIVLPPNLVQLSPLCFKGLVVSNVIAPAHLKPIFDGVREFAGIRFQYYSSNRTIYQTVTLNLALSEAEKTLLPYVSEIHVNKPLPTFLPSYFAMAKALKRVYFHIPVSKWHDLIKGHPGLEEIHFSEPLKELPAGAFRDFQKLQTLEPMAPLSEIPESCFEGCRLIDPSPFIGSETLKIGSNAFRQTALQGAIVLPAKCELGSACFEGTDVTEVDMHGVKSLGTEVFKDCKKLASVSWNKTLTTLPKGTFSGCSELTTVQNGKWTSLEDECFAGSGISKLSSPALVSSLGNGVFRGCARLTGIIAFPKIKVIPENTYRGCTGIKKIVLDQGVNRLLRYCFAECEHLQSVVIAGDVSTMGECSFRDCKELSSVEIKSPLKTMARYAFSGCLSLKRVVLPFGLESIGEASFSLCSSLASIQIPDSVRILHSKAFMNCGKLSEIRGMGGLVEVYSDAFEGCDSLTRLVFPRTLERYDCSFHNAKKLETLVFTNSLAFLSLDFASFKTKLDVYLPKVIQTLRRTFIPRSVKLWMPRGSNWTKKGNDNIEYLTVENERLVLNRFLLDAGYPLLASNARIRFTDSMFGESSNREDFFDATPEYAKPTEKKRATFATETVKEASLEVTSKPTGPRATGDKVDESELPAFSLPLPESSNGVAYEGDQSISNNIFTAIYRFDKPHKDLYSVLLSEDGMIQSDVIAIHDPKKEEPTKIIHELKAGVEDGTYYLIVTNPEGDILFGKRLRISRMFNLDDLF